MLFTDEFYFTLYRSYGRQRVYRRRGERYCEACVTERDKFVGGSVMVWGGISQGEETPLVVIHDSLTEQDNVLRPHVLRLMDPST